MPWATIATSVKIGAPFSALVLAVSVALVPILIPAVALTELASGSPSGVWEAARDDLVLIASYAGLLTSASFLLFDFVWRD